MGMVPFQTQMQRQTAGKAIDFWSKGSRIFTEWRIAPDIWEGNPETGMLWTVRFAAWRNND